MDRHFILPVTIAAAAHAGLLFGIPRGAVPKDIKSPAVLLTEVTRFINEPEKPDPQPDVAAAKSGSPDNYRPTLEEPPSAASPKDFTIQPPSTNTARMNVTTAKLTDLNFGVPTGIVDGIADIGKGVFKITDLDGSPRTRVQGAPVYPHEAKTLGLSGQVTVEFMVEENGTVSDAHAVQSTNRVFDDAAVRAVSRWKFEPGKRGGKAVRFKMAVPIVFSLNDDR